MANWNSHWIAYDSDPRQDLGVFVFQNRISLDSIPDSMLVRISADNRYKLLVNGILVSFGPQRGDILHWFYETIDLADHLNQGENEVVAVVWNFGRWSPMAQVSARTGFVLDVVGEPQSPLNTPGAWKVARLDGWDFKMMTSGGGDFYIDVGPAKSWTAVATPTPSSPPSATCNGAPLTTWRPRPSGAKAIRLPGISCLARFLPCATGFGPALR